VRQAPISDPRQVRHEEWQTNGRGNNKINGKPKTLFTFTKKSIVNIHNVVAYGRRGDALLIAYDTIWFETDVAIL
jgi:hypothetical protein